MRRSVYVVCFALALFSRGSRAEAPAADWLSSARAEDRLGVVTLAPGLALPENVVACVLGHPIDLVAIELCGGASGALKTLSQVVKLRFDLGKTRDAATGAGTQATLGPAVGLTQLWTCPVAGERCGFAAGGQLAIAYEHVWWMSRHLGWVVEANLGAAMLSTRTTPAFEETMFSPVIRLSGGVAF